MDDMIYRNNSIAEENIDPNGRPAENKFEEWSEEVSERTDPGCKDKKVKSAKERKKLIREMDEVIRNNMEEFGNGNQDKDTTYNNIVDQCDEKLAAYVRANG